MVFEGILKLLLGPIIMVQWKMAGICKVTNYFWIYTHLSLNYVHDPFRFFYKFCICRVQGSLSSVLLGTECMNVTEGTNKCT